MSGLNRRIPLVKEHWQRNTSADFGSGTIEIALTYLKCIPPPSYIGLLLIPWNNTVLFSKDKYNIRLL